MVHLRNYYVVVAMRYNAGIIQKAGWIQMLKLQQPQVEMKQLQWRLVSFCRQRMII